MNQRGRKSAAQLSVISPLRSPTRLRPPSSLSEPERAVFLDIVGGCAPEHFCASDLPLIEQYAQSILLARRAYAELESGGPVIDGKASPWLVVLEKANRSTVALAMRLRLSPQARAPRHVKPPSPGPSAYEIMGLMDDEA